MCQKGQLNKETLYRIVRGAIKEAVELHGNITPQLIDSATKRAAGRVYGELKVREKK